MWQLIYTKRFEKSVARCIKRGYDMNLLKEVANILVTGSPLPEKYRPHKLSGDFSKHWECHIKPDWLLIYRYNEEAAQLIIEDTGTHSDLFK
jgi:mRNA interferase YafQ